MLFTTAVFVGLFLPTVLAGFFLIGRKSPWGGAAWLFGASVFFYGFWQIEYVLLLLGSICFNFTIGLQIARHGGTGARRWMWFGVAVNLALLAYFKYANFFVGNLATALGTQSDMAKVVLPIGISFFTFTQIAFLVDSLHKGVREYKFVQYGLFVTYFPHLIAGPVLHHSQMMPQFNDRATFRFNSANFSAGLGIFALGLFKKIVLADAISPYADAVFTPTDAGAFPSFQEAWLATLAYTFQLYFDFSGYSDMAVGLSWMFNVRLPFNFNSPYQATSIGEFWRRWHITLSNFLRDYLYIPLGGNRRGPARRYVNLLATMLLGGLWHGAGWTFVLWGGLHGAYLVVNQLFRGAFKAPTLERLDKNLAYRIASWALTMLAVMAAWVFFRAESFGGALRMLSAMVHPDDRGSSVVLPLLWNAGLQLNTGLVWCAALGFVAFCLPNSNRIGAHWHRRCISSPVTRRILAGAAVTAIVSFVLLNTARAASSAFIYFNF